MYKWQSSGVTAFSKSPIRPKASCGSFGLEPKIPKQLIWNLIKQNLWRYLSQKQPSCVMEGCEWYLVNGRWFPWFYVTLKRVHLNPAQKSLEKILNFPLQLVT
ncbi:hypothetical protein CEXT_735951 [Caerostris extrusa]|uniref:Uncharacterized protein n=1 Tax=Caerostris extrusa TaxID=172846 RepID=A0AAV4PKK2_CAEEX|nr:hypothetical protein CEXT_735951 [Caerostris extrusa]